MNASVKNNAFNAVFLLVLSGFSFLVGLEDSEAPMMDTFQEPPLDLDDVESHARLQAFPPPSSNAYDGAGNPTVVVTHSYRGGGINGVLHQAEAWTKDAGGIDLCGERFILDDFTIFYPAGGASETDENVTYVSNSNDPSGEECNLRASPGKTWHWRVCIEFDGTLDSPRPGGSGTVFDEWDRCLEGSAGSSPPPAIPLPWEAI